MPQHLPVPCYLAEERENMLHTAPRSSSEFRSAFCFRPGIASMYWAQTVASQSLAP